MRFDELIKFFNETKLPDKPIRLNQCCTIENPKKFVESHINVLKANSGNARMKPYYNRLMDLYKILNNEQED